MKNKVFFLKKPLFGIICLILGVLLLIVSCLTDGYGLNNLNTAKFIRPTYADCSEDNIIAVVDNYERIYCIDSQGNVLYIINNNHLENENVSFGSIAVDNENRLYVHTLYMNKDNVFIKSESILRYNSDGSYDREMCRYEYDDEYVMKEKISAVNVIDNRLRYVYTQGMNEVSLLSTDTESTDFETEASYICDDYNSFYMITPSSDGSYAVIDSCDNLGMLYPDGTYKVISRPDFSLSDYNNSRVYTYPAAVNGNLYTVGGVESEKIFSVDAGSGESAEYQHTLDFFEPEPGMAENEMIYFYFYNCFTGIYDFNGKMAVTAADGLCVIDENGGHEWYCDGLVLPVNYRIRAFVSLYLIYPAVILSVIGAVICAGCIMKWRFSILSKQLCLIIPVIVLMICVIVYSMINGIRNNYYNNMNDQMLAVSELGSELLDGDKIAELNDFSSAENGSIYELHKKLSDMISNNISSWSRKFTASVYLKLDDRLVTAASSRNYMTPFISVYFWTPDENAVSDNGIGTIVERSYTTTFEMMDANTPIYSSDGRLVGYFNLSVTLDSIEEEVNGLIIKSVKQAAIFMLILIVIISLITMYIVKNLKRASVAVAEIADGNFNARVPKSSGDEIGEICSCVNDMAGQLQNFFEEKDKNEQFYYKFVPEKFRELLHKESFTDLTLGDAESADLTVLFCDIRSFSLNSEMMTAKENFEFVNLIYGKAGPVIRKNGGFVDKYIGDAVMALFETADAAVKAGIELYRDIVLDPSTAAQLGVSSVNIGIGIHSGMARIGIVGEEERMSGTVISNTVNLSSRLESLTKQYNTAMIISKDTLDRMSDPDSLNTRYLGMIQVAGVNEVKALYEVLDCLDEQRKEERMSVKADFREAVKLFHLGKADESVSLFEQIRSKSGVSDIAVDKYIDYIKGKIASGDKEHNVFKFDKK